MKHILIENKSGKIKLNDIVMQPVMDDLIAEIGRIFGAKAAAAGTYSGELTNCAENAVDELEIVIHSPGGSVLDGYTLYNEIIALRARGVHVTATINSLAASMASVIAMACDTIRMVPNGQMMIHEVKQGVMGDAAKLAAAAKTCDEMSQAIAEIYAARTGKPASEMRDLMRKETWMGAKEALASGFIDALFDIRPANPTTTAMNVLKVLFPGKEAEISQVEASLAEVDSLRNELTAHLAEISTLKAENVAQAHTIAEHLATIATREEAITGHLATITAHEATIAERDASITTLTAQVEAAKNSAGQIATETLAAIGQPAPIENGEKGGGVNHLEVFNSLKGAEASAYFKKHEKEIAEAQRAAVKTT